MAQYIDKSALVAEIEKLQLSTMDEYMNYYSQEAQGEYNALVKLETFLDTLEVKEVDLNAAVERYVEQHKSELNGYFDIRRIARHFFELGLKAQKGE